MKKRIIILLSLLVVLLTLCSCSNNSKNSTFNIQFIDVGQGDSALVECDGRYMLIDGGDESAGKKVRDILEDKGIQKLDILAISHLHADHFEGLISVLQYAQTIKLTICNSDYIDKEKFKKFEHQLSINDASITVPKAGKIYNLGSAKVEVIDNGSDQNNDSLVLMITYGKNKFLFTGDIEESAQERIIDKYKNDSDEAYDIDLIKMPHHGAKSNKMYVFLRTFKPEYAVISVGEGNKYGHPDSDTLDKLEDEGAKVYRTDKDGDIFVKSNGESISIETSK